MSRAPFEPEDVVREHGRPAWTELQQARVRARVRAELEVGPRLAPSMSMGRFAAVGALALALSFGAFLGLRGEGDPSEGTGAGFASTDQEHLPSTGEPSNGLAGKPWLADGGRLVWADGSWVRPLTPETRVEVSRSQDALVEVRLGSGRVQVEVAPNAARVFRVLSGLVSVEVLGTRFAVERQGELTRVDVSEGLVRVASDREEIVLSRGQGTAFRGPEMVAPKGEDTEPERSEAEEVPERSARRDRAARSGARAEVDAPRWQRLAERGRWQEAASALNDRVRFRSIEERMLAADAYRLSGAPKRAYEVLRPISREHPGDPRAPLALFTEAQLLLKELDHPHAAAQAFQKLQARYPKSSLTEDALAREAEAWAAAGEDARARARAEAYLRRFPEGHRADSVRSLLR